MKREGYHGPFSQQYHYELSTIQERNYGGEGKKEERREKREEGRGKGKRNVIGRGVLSY